MMPNCTLTNSDDFAKSIDILEKHLIADNHVSAIVVMKSIYDYTVTSKQLSEAKEILLEIEENLLSNDKHYSLENAIQKLRTIYRKNFV